MVVIEEEDSYTLSPKKVSPYESSLWSGDDFDAIKFIGAHLPFLEGFPGAYTAVYNNPSPKVYNLKENHLLRVLFMEHADREEHAQTENELRTKLSSYKGDLTKGKTIIDALQKDNTMEGKL